MDFLLGTIYFFSLSFFFFNFSFEVLFLGIPPSPPRNPYFQTLFFNVHWKCVQKYLLNFLVGVAHDSWSFVYGSFEVLWFCNWLEKRGGEETSSYWDPSSFAALVRRFWKRESRKNWLLLLWGSFQAHLVEKLLYHHRMDEAWSLLLGTFKKWKFLFYELVSNLGEAREWFPSKILEAGEQELSLKIDRWTDTWNKCQ